MNGIFVLPSSTRIQFQRFPHTRYVLVSKYELTLSLETGVFKYVSRARYFFCNADFTLYACFFLAGYHLKFFGDGCISAGDVFEKEEDGIIDC